MPKSGGRRAAMALSAGVVLTSMSHTGAATTLTVDLATTIRPVTHVANGSLYGVTETIPADDLLPSLVGELHPNMFVNPAANVQRPFGDAIVVASRLAPFGATMTIRFSDWFTGYYAFTNMEDFREKLTTTVNRKKEANLTNIYAYEIWNEPNLSWGSDKPMPFNEFWRQSYAILRELDPEVDIAGPSPNVVDEDEMREFLLFCQENDCLPDIMVWHEGEYIENSVNLYRRIEREVGVGPLRISINEYCGYGQLRDEGKPGTMGPLIAQLERSGVETAAITWWDTPHPGRLGSLLATDTDRNGGWFFYKWYGDMTGNMVAATSSAWVNGKNLDGFASMDEESRNAYVIFAGENDGSVEIVVEGFSAAPFFGDTVHAVVERTPFVDRSTIVTETETVSTADLPITGGRIAVTVRETNASDGYRLSLTPVGGVETGGAGGGAGSGSAADGGATESGSAGALSGGSGGGAGAEPSLAGVGGGIGFGEAVGGASGSATGAASGDNGEAGAVDGLSAGAPGALGVGGATGGHPPAVVGGTTGGLQVGTTGGGLGQVSTVGGASGGAVPPLGGTTASGLGSGGRSTGGAHQLGGASGGGGVGPTPETTRGSSDDGGCGCGLVGTGSGRSPLAPLAVLGLVTPLLLRRRRK